MYCALRPEVIAIDPNGHRYFPYFVELHRCSGSCSTISPATQHCVAKAWEDIPVKVYDYAQSKDNIIVTVKNHTLCGCECVTDPSSCDYEVQDWDQVNCRCKCRYPDEPPAHLPPKEGFRLVSIHPFIHSFIHSFIHFNGLPSYKPGW